jgi:hypothetical protein
MVPLDLPMTKYRFSNASLACRSTCFDFQSACASMKSIPCFALFLSLLSGSNSNSTLSILRKRPRHLQTGPRRCAFTRCIQKNRRRQRPIVSGLCWGHKVIGQTAIRESEKFVFAETQKPTTRRRLRQGCVGQEGARAPQIRALLTPYPGKDLLPPSAMKQPISILPARPHILRQPNTDEHQCGSSAKPCPDCKQLTLQTSSRNDSRIWGGVGY